MRQHVNLLDARTTNGSGTGLIRPGNVWNYQAVITGTGAVSATVTIEVSEDGNNWETFGTMSLSGTTSDSDAVGGDRPWAMHRATVASITGTGAAVSVHASGVEG